MALTLRLVPELHRRAVLQSERTGISLNRLLAVALDQYLTRNEARQHSVKRGGPAIAPDALTAPAVPAQHARIVQQPLQRPRVGRNERCPCGSGRKFKVCCINKGNV